jgi:hypothetical protein
MYKYFNKKKFICKPLCLQHVSIRYGSSAGRNHINQLCIKDNGSINLLNVKLCIELIVHFLGYVLQNCR